jgi:hypothetical protein
MRRSCMIACSVLCLAVCTAAQAQSEDEARQHYRQGREYYEQGRYEEALRSFTAANKVKPSPLLDYNMARCHEKLGNNKEAVAAYERYLAGQPYASNRDEVAERIAELKQAEAPPPTPPPTPPPATQPDLPHEAAPGGEPLPPPKTAEEPGMPEGAGASPAGKELPHEAAAAPGAPRRPDRRGGPPKPPPKREEGPFYKQWWFWVGCAGAAVILGFVIATAVHKPESNDPHATTKSGLRFSF